MRTYKTKDGQREAQAVQYEGSLGQRKGISFYLTRQGYMTRLVGASGIGLVNREFPNGRVGRVLEPTDWLVVRTWKQAHDNKSVKSVQFMKDADFRKGFEVTHGED